MNSRLFDNQEFFKQLTTMIESDQVVSFPVKGNSMLPFLKDRETEVFVKKSESYKPYDICLFEFHGKTILHRLIKIKSDKFFFRGDHLYNMEVVDQAAIIAKVTHYITNNRSTVVNRPLYQLKITIYLLFKQIKMVVRNILKRKSQ